MDKDTLIKLINEEKSKRGISILAHTYQAPEIIDIADVTGDSFVLSQAATELKNNTVIMCGVRFMAETVKILSPEKTVILAAENATCPMAEQISPETIIEYRKNHPDTTVCSYINTITELKAVSDVCVTSSSAVKIVKALENNDILFIPDYNLGSYVKQSVPEKNIQLLNGCCPIHSMVTVDDVLKIKQLHPDAKLAVHPECIKEVTALADYAGSTSGIIKYALESDAEVILGTERGVFDYLSREYPERKFYQLAPEKLVCRDMKYTTLESVYNTIIGNGGSRIELDEQLRLAAKRSIDNMLYYGSK